MPDHRPWVDRKFGVELEITERKANGGALSDVAIRHAIQPLTNRLNPARTGWYKSNGRTWDMKTDSSCGWELASPAMTLDIAGLNDELGGICGALENLGAVCDNRCGTHVHFELSEYDWRDLQRLMILWVRYEPFFYSLQPANRRAKHYCTPLYRKEWDGSDSANYRVAQAACRATNQTAFEREARRIGEGQRLGLNIGGFWRTRRIEIRLHSGTVNYHKIRHWVMLMSALIARPKLTSMPEIIMMGTNRNPTGLSTEYICKQLGLLPSRFLPAVPQESIELAAWLEQRRQQFANRVVATTVAPVVVPPEVHSVDLRLCAARVGQLCGRGRGRAQWGEPGNSCHHIGITGRQGCAAHTADWNAGTSFRSTQQLSSVDVRNIRDSFNWTDVSQTPDPQRQNP